MVVAIDVLGDELADQTAKKNIRRKMLLAPYSRNADEGGQTVANNFWEEAGIFVSKNSGYGPRGSGMLGRKRSTPLEEGAGTIALIGTLATQRIFHELNGDETVDGRFAGKQSGLAPVFVLGWITKKEKSRASAYERAETSCGVVLVLAYGVGIIGKVTAEVRVGGEECRGDTAGGQQPIGIRE